MAFGVFIHRQDSIYDDSPAERYQFPAQYISRAKACVGDWIIYYEPRKVIGTRGYFAIAKVQNVIADPAAKGMFLAIMEQGSYLDFANPVPFHSQGRLAEQGLLNGDGRISGRAQSAVRPISTIDFDRITTLGLEQHELPLPRLDPASPWGVQEQQAPFDWEPLDRTEYLTSRKLRDRIFRQVVLTAYGQRCAVTGLRLINGGGRAEVAAAHIRPVQADGPDILSNGIALSGTAHWMFDRGLVSLTDDLRILISRHVNDRQGIETIINKNGIAFAPTQPRERPHPRFLEWHRRNCFKE